MMAHERLRIFLSFVLAGAMSGGVTAQTESRRQIRLHYERAQNAFRGNQLETAAKEFRQILQLDPKSAEALGNLGVIAFKQGRFAQAAQLFSGTLKLNPSLWDAKAFLGLCQIRLGQEKEGEPLLEQSFRHIQTESLRIDAGVAVLKFHQETKTLDQAVDVVRDLERLSPNDPEVLYVVYRAYSELAAQAVAALAQRAPGSGRMHQILAQAALTQDDVQGAIAEYRKALETDPHLSGIHYELGRAILARSREQPAVQEAELEFEAELAANSTDAGSEYELGEICRSRSDFQRAEKHYTRALALRAGFVDAHIALAKALTSLGRSAEAFPHLLDASHLDPDNEAAHYQLAQAYRRNGRTEEAERETALFLKLRKAHSPTRSASPQADKEYP